ncbi:hypothetical protein BZZ01_12275 [Nostocales cyanobacterium HT-58-2]|nr:hypothetical protein BZZ01_12275 [Nostocales cyanobacterium HT-58-2]
MNKVEFNQQNGTLFFRFASLHSFFSNSRTHFSIFRKQTSRLLSQLVCLLLHFGVFRKRTSRLLSQLVCLLSYSSNSRNPETIALVAKAIENLPEFSQADQHGSFLR